jgi:P27 family predicted phage terminase small subunit
MRKLPDNVHRLMGNPSKRRHLPGIQPEIPAEPPDPPAFLSPAAAGEWRRLAGELVRLGLLSSLDVMPFASYCAAYGVWSDALQLAAADDIAPNARRLLAEVARGAGKDMVRLAKAFGMTPASRAGVVGGTRLEASKFDGLIV